MDDLMVVLTKRVDDLPINSRGEVLVQHGNGLYRTFVVSFNGVLKQVNTSQCKLVRKSGLLIR